MKVDIGLVQLSPYQPRLVFDLWNLKQEIKKDGLLNELTVRKKGGRPTDPAASFFAGISLTIIAVHRVRRSAVGGGPWALS